MNLIVTCGRHLEFETREEIKAILKELGDENPNILKTNMRGILTVITKLEPLDVVEKIRRKIIEEPWSIRYCLRVIPIQSVLTTTVEDIKNEVSKLARVIKPLDNYRITIEKRNSNISTSEIISKIAENLPYKVSLKEQDWIILIEILGNRTGVSVLKKNSILSLEKMKRSLSD